MNTFLILTPNRITWWQFSKANLSNCIFRLEENQRTWKKPMLTQGENRNRENNSSSALKLTLELGGGKATLCTTVNPRPSCVTAFHHTSNMVLDTYIREQLIF